MSVRDLRDLALAAKQGGVGYYQRSDFVHIDTGASAPGSVEHRWRHYGVCHVDESREVNSRESLPAGDT